VAADAAFCLGALPLGARQASSAQLPSPSAPCSRFPAKPPDACDPVLAEGQGCISRCNKNNKEKGKTMSKSERINSRNAWWLAIVRNDELTM